MTAADPGASDPLALERELGSEAGATEAEADQVWGVTKPFPDWFKGRRVQAHRMVGAWVPVVLIGLPLGVLVAIVIYPTVWMFYHAFQNTSLMTLFNGNWSSVGFANFAEVLTSDRFANAMGNMGVYLTFGAALQVVIGTAVALMLYELVRPRWLQVVLLVLLVLPMMMPPSVVGTLWRFLLQADNGAINWLLIHLGVLGEGARINWFSFDLALWSVTLADTWEWTALPLLIVYSARVSLPPSVYEAARVDGASRGRVLFRLTLPMLQEIIGIAFILRFMDAYKFVDKVDVMTSGGPAQASELPALIAFQKGIREFEVGIAAAHAIIIFILAALLIVLFLAYLKRVMKARGVMG